MQTKKNSSFRKNCFLKTLVILNKIFLGFEIKLIEIAINVSKKRGVFLPNLIIIIFLFESKSLKRTNTPFQKMNWKLINGRLCQLLPDFIKELRSPQIKKW